MEQNSNEACNIDLKPLFSCLKNVDKIYIKNIDPNLTKR